MYGIGTPVACCICCIHGPLHRADVKVIIITVQLIELPIICEQHFKDTNNTVSKKILVELPCCECFFIFHQVTVLCIQLVAELTCTVLYKWV